MNFLLSLCSTKKQQSFLISIFRLKSRTYEEKRNFFILVFLTFLVFIFSSILLLILFMLYFGDKWVLNIKIALGSLLVVFFIGFFLLSIFRKIQLYLFYFNTFITFVIMFVHIMYAKMLGGIFMGSPLVLLSMLSALAIFSGNKFQQIFWSINTFAMMLICFIVDLFLIDIDHFAQKIVGVEPGLRVFDAIYTLYFMIFFNSIVVTSTTLSLKYIIDRDMKLIMKVIMAFQVLNFEESTIKLLLQKSNDFCTSLETLLKNLILNMKVFKSYLPDHIWSMSKFSKDGNAPKLLVKLKKRSSSSLFNLKLNLKSNNKYRTSIMEIQENSSFLNVDYGLKSKEVVLMDITVPKFSQNDLDLSMFENMLSIYLNTVSLFVQRSKGLVHCILRDYIRVSFNTDQRICMNAEIKACSCAVGILESLKKDGLNCKISIISDVMLIGNMKSGKRTKYFIISEKENFQKEMMRSLQRSETQGHDILLCSDINDAAKYAFSTKKVDFGLNEESFVLLEKKQIKSDEWLYEISDSLKE